MPGQDHMYMYICYALPFWYYLSRKRQIIKKIKDDNIAARSESHCLNRFKFILFLCNILIPNALYPTTIACIWMFPYICVLQILTHLRCTIYKYVCHSFLFTAKAAVSREAIPFNLQSLKVWGSINVVVVTGISH